jgi:multicomponent Na+:H+ antiporter subunit E
LSNLTSDKTGFPFVPALFLFLAVFGLWLLWSGSLSLPPVITQLWDHGEEAHEETAHGEHDPESEGAGEGHGEHHVVWPLLLGLGLLSSLGVVLLCHRLGILDDELVPFHLTLPTLGYVPWLTLEVVRSNLDVIRRVLGGGERIDPVVVTIRTSLRGDIPRVTYANSITLTPGTLTLDAEEDRLTVHALSRDGAKDLARGEMERRIARLEGGG